VVPSELQYGRTCRQIPCMNFKHKKATFTHHRSWPGRAVIRSALLVYLPGKESDVDIVSNIATVFVLESFPADFEWLEVRDIELRSKYG